MLLLFTKMNVSMKTVTHSSDSVLETTPVNISEAEEQSSFNSKQQSVNLEFVDLSCEVEVGIFKNAKKKILHNIHGQFANGKLIAILGPSGSGKTTLLNVLSGYTTAHISGKILTNGRQRNLKEFRKASSYITQESTLQALLTVQESMKFAADFKLGPDVSNREKLIVINDLLNTFKLDNCRDTKTTNLSGGERKRLSIALELINNPSVIFLDEPTSGLDSSAAFQCIKYLKLLTKYGRTIICTIHQPTASIFHLFDHTYILSEGKCVYQGNPDCLIPFLHNLGMDCPTYHNPADFVIEIACNEYGEESIKKLVKAIKNGKHVYTQNPIFSTKDLIHSEYKEHVKAANSEFSQLQILLRREYLKAKRDPCLTYMRMIVSITNSLLLGVVFWQVGDDGAKIWFNYNAILGIILHFMMPALMLTVLTFPTQLPVIRSEHFNNWYSLKSYYLSITLIDFPVSFLYCVISNLIIYPMTGQPMELYRFEMWTFISLLITMVAQSLGLLIGSVVNMINGAFAASAVSFPFLMLAGFGIKYRDLSNFFYACTYLSYLRYGVEGMIDAVYGYNRKPLRCPHDYCLYHHASIFLEDMYLSAGEYWTDVVVLCGILVVFKLLGYCALKWKVARVR